MLKNLLFAAFISVIVFSCRKDEVITDHSAGIVFSTDTVFFDTILTTLGSITKQFKIFNPHSEDIVISNIHMAGGNSSYYKMNIDGSPGNDQNNIKIRAKDSIFVFVNVTIDPLASNSPVVVSDSVVCVTNGNVESLKLIAFGQDVNLFRGKIIKSQTWTSQKPYLIFNNTAIDSNEVLIIEAGTTIYLNNNSSLIVWGQLDARGTLEKPIVFTGDRFDGRYASTAGQWGTIYFDPKSTGNKLKYTIIKNAIAGLQVWYPLKGYEPSVELDNCMILNSASVGIYAFGANIKAYNSIIADCGQYALLFLMGGDYNFSQCTITNISANAPGLFSDQGYKSRSTPSVFVSNFIDWSELDENFNPQNVTYHNDVKDLNFYNSILYGIRDQEVQFQDDKKSAFNYMFNHCILKNNKDSFDYSNPVHFKGLILNKDPLLINDSISKGPFDFQLDSLSPAIDSGSIDLIEGIPQLQRDYNGINRTTDGKPDIGAYEYHQ